MRTVPAGSLQQHNTEPDGHHQGHGSAADRLCRLVKDRLGATILHIRVGGRGGRFDDGLGVADEEALGGRRSATVFWTIPRVSIKRLGRVLPQLPGPDLAAQLHSYAAGRAKDACKDDGHCGDTF